MSSRKVLCPSCGTILQVPQGLVNVAVRCSHCQNRFRLPPKAMISDDAIASWLGGAKTRVDPDDIDEEIEQTEAPSLGGTAVLPIENPEAPSAPPPALRLVRFGKNRALFEFPASRLRDVSFRCAMPRQCLRCGARAHLVAHVVIYSGKMVDNMSLEMEHAAGDLILDEDQTRDLTTEQLLDRLPPVPNVPAPGNLPMPYWVCDMCSGAGLISGQIEVNSQTGNGWCRLMIYGLRRAAAFLEAAGGKDSDGFRVLHEHIETMAENPWENLPSVIQHRIEGWYKPAVGEQFITYVPDRDHSRTEDGMNGLVVSNRRVIFHDRMRHFEGKIQDALKVKVSAGAKLQIHIESAILQVRGFTLEREGLNSLRRSLTLGGFKASWQ
jgi:LSD1 subclass zinc finger protein